MAIGHSDVESASGSVRIRRVDGSAAIKNSYGDTTIGEVAGELRVKGAYGSIWVDRALGSVDVKTAHGNVRLDEVVRGEVHLESSYGALEVGIRRGTAAWLDVATQHGSVLNSLGAQDGPRGIRGDRRSAGQKLVGRHRRSPFQRTDHQEPEQLMNHQRREDDMSTEMTTTRRDRGPAIRVQGLEKSYKELHVLRGVDFEVAPGSIFALLGSNGAGKTTIVRILSTLLRPDAGTSTVEGFDVTTDALRVRESISLTGQFAAVDEILSGRENLVLVARLRHLNGSRPDRG